MDLSALFTSTTHIGFGLFAIVCFWCYRLMTNKRYLILFVWPIVIYFCGPLFTGIFADTPVLGNFVFPEYTLAETLMIFLYFVSFIVADHMFDVSGIINYSMSHPTIRRLSYSMAFLPIFVVTVMLAIGLQIKLLHDVGSVLTGTYAMLGVDEGLVPYWGFLAGLYEIIFLLFILFILSEGHGLKMRIFVIGAYCLTALLRVAGGTRLILVKELAFVVILFFLRGRLKRRQLILAVGAIVTLGSIIGLLRTGEVDEEAVLGPVFGLVMESALDSLTLNIAYKLQDTGYVAQNADDVKTAEFLLLSSIPSFARFSITPAELTDMSPYNSALRYGFSTYSPVGGMSGFATICYICSYPLLASILLAFSLSAICRYAPAGNLKRITVLVFLLNSIHFWRDPVDIGVKLVVQDDFCALVLLVVGSMYLRPRKKASVSLNV
jgi:hypothetical protein